MSMAVCESCGMPFEEHSGLQWTCARLLHVELQLAAATKAADDWRDVAATLAIGGDGNPSAAWASALQHYEDTLLKENGGGAEL
jgi:hypothetical protein